VTRSQEGPFVRLAGFVGASSALLDLAFIGPRSDDSLGREPIKDVRLLQPAQGPPVANTLDTP
jgi:hypothetical protein